MTKISDVSYGEGVLCALSPSQTFVFADRPDRRVYMVLDVRGPMVTFTNKEVAVVDLGSGSVATPDAMSRVLRVTAVSLTEEPA